MNLEADTWRRQPVATTAAARARPDAQRRQPPARARRSRAKPDAQRTHGSGAASRVDATTHPRGYLMLGGTRVQCRQPCPDDPCATQPDARRDDRAQRAGGPGPLSGSDRGRRWRLTPEFSCEAAGLEL